MVRGCRGVKVLEFSGLVISPSSSLPLLAASSLVQYTRRLTTTLSRSDGSGSSEEVSVYPPQV